MITVLIIVGIALVVAMFFPRGREAVGAIFSGLFGWMKGMFADGKGIVPIIGAVTLLILVAGVTAVAKNPQGMVWWYGGVGPGYTGVKADAFDEGVRERILYPGLDPTKDYADTEATDHSAGPDGTNNPLIRAQADVILTGYQIETTDNRTFLNEKDAESQCALPVEARTGVWNDGDAVTKDPDPCDYINKVASENFEDIKTATPEAGRSIGQAVGNFFSQVFAALDNIKLFTIKGEQITLLAALVVGLLAAMILRAMTHNKGG